MTSSFFVSCAQERNQYSKSKMTRTFTIALFVIVTLSAAWADQAPLAIKKPHEDANGVTLQTASGTLRIEACGDRVVHVVASPNGEIPPPKVSVAMQPCQANHLAIKIGKREVT